MWILTPGVRHPSVSGSFPPVPEHRHFRGCQQWGTCPEPQEHEEQSPASYHFVTKLCRSGSGPCATQALCYLLGMYFQNQGLLTSCEHANASGWNAQLRDILFLLPAPIQECHIAGKGSDASAQPMTHGWCPEALGWRRRTVLALPAPSPAGRTAAGCSTVMQEGAGKGWDLHVYSGA